VRLAGVQLVELVHRGGSIAPWSYLPPVVALTTDTHAGVSERAVGILKYCAAKPVCSQGSESAVKGRCACALCTKRRAQVWGYVNLHVCVAC
jgi:Sister chromatid cohesion C-terminus